jgi:hypothetical protein
MIDFYRERSLDRFFYLIGPWHNAVPLRIWTLFSVHAMHLFKYLLPLDWLDLLTQATNDNEMQLFSPVFPVTEMQVFSPVFPVTEMQVYSPVFPVTEMQVFSPVFPVTEMQLFSLVFPVTEMQLFSLCLL